MTRREFLAVSLAALVAAVVLTFERLAEWWKDACSRPVAELASWLPKTPAGYLQLLTDLAEAGLIKRHQAGELLAMYEGA